MIYVGASLDIHSQATFRSQNVCGPLFAMFKNSMEPVYSDELVPPRVKIPPYSVFVARALPRSRVSWKAISGDENWPPSDKDCQKGVDFVAVRAENARPMRPEAGAAMTS